MIAHRRSPAKPLEKKLHDIAEGEDVAYIYIAVFSNNWASRRVIEKVDFEYQGGISYQKRFGYRQFSLINDRSSE